MLVGYTIVLRGVRDPCLCVSESFSNLQWCVIHGSILCAQVAIKVIRVLITEQVGAEKVGAVRCLLKKSISFDSNFINYVVDSTRSSIMVRAQS